MAHNEKSAGKKPGQVSLGRGPTVRADGKLVRTLRENRGITQSRLAELAKCCARTVKRVERDGKCLAEVLQAIEAVLEADCSLNAATVANQSPPPATAEWQVAYADLAWERRTLPNGIEVEVFELPSQTQNRRARAKRYSLMNATKDDCALLDQILRRHTSVCSQIRSPHVAKSYVSESDGRLPYWWVIDEWIDGLTLQATPRNRLTIQLRASISLQVLKALQSLHQADIICRGLSPESIFVRLPDGFVVVTDFELAKIMDAPTVSPQSGFKPSPYFAPEVRQGGRNIGAEADLYSWALITAEMFLQGVVVANDVSTAGLVEAGIPPDCATLIQKSLAVAPAGRPRSVRDPLKPLTQWVAKLEAEALRDE